MSSKTIEKKLEKDKEELHKFMFSNFSEILGEDWSIDDINALIEAGVSRHDLEKLLQQGCSKELAVKILL